MTMAALTKDVFCLEVFQVADPSSQEIQSLLVDVDRYIGERLQASPIVTTAEYSLMELIPGVYFYRFDKQSESAPTFMRIQEHFESPEFRGKVFSQAEYEAWYKTTNEDGVFSYYTDWSGFNFPSYVLDAFYDGRFTEITARERRVLDAFRRKHQRGEKFYVIGTSRHRTNTDQKPMTAQQARERELVVTRHEIAHAMYYRIPEYRQAVDEVLLTIPPKFKAKLYDFLSNSGGYHDSVLQDELHANLVANWNMLYKKGVDYAEVTPQIVRLIKIYRRHLLP